MWTNYCIVAADNLLMKDKPSIKVPSITCFGLVTCRVKGWQLETGCVVEGNFSYFILVSKAKVMRLKSDLQSEDRGAC